MTTLKTTLEELPKTIDTQELNRIIEEKDGLAEKIIGLGTAFVGSDSSDIFNYIEWITDVDNHPYSPLQVKDFPPGTSLYDANSFLDKILQAGAEVLTFCDFIFEEETQQILAYRKSATNANSKGLVVQGKVSTFGGPDDDVLKNNEGLAMIEESEIGLYPPNFFLTETEAGFPGLAKRLNPDVHYIAARWNYKMTPRGFLQDVVVEVENPANGKKENARVVDWGPHSKTGKNLDLSPGLATALDLKTKDFAIARIPTHTLFKSTDSYTGPVGSTPQNFFDFISLLGLKHFKPHEFLVNTNKSVNRVPPKKYWHNIVPAALVLDRLRSHFGKPVRLTSTYRNPSYNAGVKGATYSQHLDFRAIDFQCDSVSTSEVTSYLKTLRDETFLVPFELKLKKDRAPLDLARLNIRSHGGQSTFNFHGSIGTYSNFVHLDGRGEDRNWSS